MGRPKKNQNTASSYVPKKVQSLETLEDIIPELDPLWNVLLKRVARFSRVYGFEKIETPLLEDLRLYELFHKTSIQNIKNIITIPNGGKNVALRADFLPSVLRSYYEHKIYEKSPLSKWSYGGFVVKQDSHGELQNDYQFGYEGFWHV